MQNSISTTYSNTTTQAPLSCIHDDWPTNLAKLANTDAEPCLSKTEIQNMFMPLFTRNQAAVTQLTGQEIGQNLSVMYNETIASAPYKSYAAQFNRLCSELSIAETELEIENENYAKALAEPGKPSSSAEGEAMRAPRDKAYRKLSDIKTAFENLKEESPAIAALHNTLEGLSSVSSELNRDWWMEKLREIYGCNP